MGGAYEPSPGVDYSTDGVRMLKIFNDYSTSEWAVLPSLPKKLSLGESAIINKYIYYAGGYTWEGGSPQHFSKSVFYSEVTEEGLSGSWKTTLELPWSLSGFGMVSDGNYLYIVGGETQQQFSNQTLIGVISTNGEVVSWTPSKPLPVPVYRGNVYKIDGKILILGGYDGNNYLDKIFVSELQTDGTLGDWTESPVTLPKKMCCSAMAIVKDKIFLMGGYSEGYLNDVYSLNVADILGPSTPSVTPTPQPTPTVPVPTPTLTPTPTPERRPLVFLPGMGASFNRDALVYGKENVPDTDWKIGFYTSVYDGIIKSLEASGYQKEKNLFIYPYDWRDDVRVTSNRLEEYVRKTVLKDRSDTKVDLVGHSLGGLVARFSAQRSPDLVNTLITVGTPHNGAVDAYRAWEGVDFNGLSSAEIFALQTMLRIQRKDSETKVQALHSIAPSLQNILPTFDYIKNKDGKLIRNNKMIWQNNALPSADGKLNSLLSFTKTLSGTGVDTGRYLIVEPPSQQDKDLGKWTDGKPIRTQYSSGDGTILIESSTIPGTLSNLRIPNAGHSQIISGMTGQLNILQMLGIQGPAFDVYQEDKKQFVSVVISSPATFTVTAPDNKVYQDNEGVVFISSPPKGNYKVRLTATGKGDYKLYFGRFNGGDVAWEETSGSFQKTGQTFERSFVVDLSSRNLGFDPIKDILNRLKQLKVALKGYGIRPIVNQIINNETLPLELLINQYLQPKNKQKLQLMEKMFKELSSMSKRLDSQSAIKSLPPILRMNIQDQLTIIRQDIEEEMLNLQI